LTEKTINYASRTDLDEISHIFTEFNLTGRVTNVNNEIMEELTKWCELNLDFSGNYLPDFLFGKNARSEYLQFILNYKRPLVISKPKLNTEDPKSIRDNIYRMVEDSNYVTEREVKRMLELKEKIISLTADRNEIKEFTKLKKHLQTVSQKLKAEIEKLLIIEPDPKIENYIIKDVETKRKIENAVIKTMKFVNPKIFKHSNVNIEIKKDVRSYFDPVTSSIVVDNVDSVSHELGHYIEHNLTPEKLDQVKEFYSRRTRFDKIESLANITGLSYEAMEKTKKDKFIDPYMGKIYPEGHTEIISMGLEMMIKNPAFLATNDPELFDFIYIFLRKE